MDFEYWLRGTYVVAAVFGLGVTAIDLLGLLGSHHHDTTIDGDGGGAEMHDGLDLAQAADGNGHASDSTDGSAHEGADAATNLPSAASNLMFALRYLRRLVYFSLGFGPVGLVALSGGAGWLVSLVWALPVGLVSAWLAGAFFRFQQKDVDSTVSDRELFLETAEVTVGISPGELGRVRVIVGNSAIDRFARAEAPSIEIAKGERVIITDVLPEYVVVSSSTTRPALPNP